MDAVLRVDDELALPVGVLFRVLVHPRGAEPLLRAGVVGDGHGGRHGQQFLLHDEVAGLVVVVRRAAARQVGQQVETELVVRLVVGDLREPFGGLRAGGVGRAKCCECAGLAPLGG